MPPHSSLLANYCGNSIKNDYLCKIIILLLHMVIVKRLYTFMLQQFLPLLAMTFFISLFIVLMQFLYKIIDDLVGKGLSLGVIGELFFYAALSLVPTALPIAILLASLMTFGNLGEKFELTAMKAAGISLIRIMSPLIAFIVLVAIGAFFFQNNVLPVAQTKMWTLVFSMRQKSPEVEIPERAFYDQIPGINLYVEKKNPETGMLYDMIIYDVSKGLDNSRVILADSGKLNFTEDKTHLFLQLYQGEMFENIRDNALGSSSNKYLPFRRESFDTKKIYMTFDANFNRIDEGAMRNQYIGKNIVELRHSIDSIGAIIDSVGTRYGSDLQARTYLNVSSYRTERIDTSSEPKYQRIVIPPVAMPRPIDIDSLFATSTPSQQKTYISQAMNKARQNHDEYQFRSVVIKDQSIIMRRHGIEMHRKFTLSFACLVFFFIGAPLGAIIKKGGLGTPLVISVLLFVFYYIIDNTGFKLARDGKIEVWEGIWLSSAVLLPLGVYFTYKAVGDSSVFNMDAITAFFNRLRGKLPERTLEPKEVIMNEVVPATARGMLTSFIEHVSIASATKRTLIDKILSRPKLNALDDELNNLIDYLSNSRNKQVIALLNKYPFALTYKLLPQVIDISRQILDTYPQPDEPATISPD